LQQAIRRTAPGLPVIIITAFGSIQTAVESMKLGAFDYITKPFATDELLMAVARAFENRQLRQEVKRLRGELADRDVAIAREVEHMERRLLVLATVGSAGLSPVADPGKSTSGMPTRKG
jgi:DNA-binding NtrC family response regulator